MQGRAYTAPPGDTSVKEAEALGRLGAFWLDHLIRESAIPLDAILERGYREARSTEDLVGVGFAPDVAERHVGALIIPWHATDGRTVVHQIKVRQPRKGAPKYLLPEGFSPVVHCRPSTRGPVDVPRPALSGGRRLRGCCTLLHDGLLSRLSVLRAVPAAPGLLLYDPIIP